MKAKLKNKGTLLPNCWKVCGCSFDDWQKLQNGESVEIKNFNNLEHLFDYDAPKSKKGDK